MQQNTNQRVWCFSKTIKITIYNCVDKKQSWILIFFLTNFISVGEGLYCNLYAAILLIKFLMQEPNHEINSAFINIMATE